MKPPQLTNKRIALAFAIAALADLMQFPVTAVTATGIFFIPGEFADFMIDCGVMGATTFLLGFHWMLLPTIFVELVPGLDLIPTWTGCVAFVVVSRKREQAQVQTSIPAQPIPSAAVIQNPAQLASPPKRQFTLPPVEDRLKKLDEMLQKKIITPADYESRKKRILSGL